jgi:hypothetical protein
MGVSILNLLLVQDSGADQVNGNSHTQADTQMG